MCQGFFPGFGKTGMDLGTGSVGCGVAYFFEGLAVVKVCLEQELWSPQSQIRVTSITGMCVTGGSPACGELAPSPLSQLRASASSLETA